MRLLNAAVGFAILGFCVSAGSQNQLDLKPSSPSGTATPSAGTATFDANASEPEKSLLALDREWIEAEVGHDRMALERILNDGFMVTLASGDTLDKAAFVERILSKPILPFEVVHETVRVHGDTAIVVDSLAIRRELKFIWVAVKRHGQWRVVEEIIINKAQIVK